MYFLLELVKVCFWFAIDRLFAHMREIRLIIQIFQAGQIHS